MEVLLHMEEILGRGVPVYHVAMGYRLGPFSRRFDFHPTNGNNMRKVLRAGDRRVVRLGRTRRTMREVVSFENGLDKRYFLALNDCRHYTQRMLDFSIEERNPKLTDLGTLRRLFEIGEEC